MSRHKQTPEEMREKLKKEEMKNPSSSINGGNLSGLTEGIGWKASGVIVLVLLFGLTALLLLASI